MRGINRTVFLLALLSLANEPSSPIKRQLSHGTSEILLVAPGVVVGSADSKEVITSFFSDGTSFQQDHESCKVRQAGPLIAMVAGYVRAQSFDALDFIARAIRPSEALHDFALRLMGRVDETLRTVLAQAASAGDNAFRDVLSQQDALEIALIGSQGRKPAVELLVFQAHRDQSGRVTVQSRESRCPGDCPDGHAAYFLGVHGAVDKAVRSQPALAKTATLQTAAMLNRLEYVERPDIVGGPQTLIKADADGISIVEPGACLPAAHKPADAATFESFRNELDYRLSAITNLVCHQTMRRYSATKHETHADLIDADLRIVGGKEFYTDIQKGERAYRSFDQLRGAWATGDLMTMLRSTRASLTVDGTRLLSRMAPDGIGERGVRYHRDASDRAWLVMVDSRMRPVSFEGTAWFSELSGELRQIEWRSEGDVGPTRFKIAQVDWRVDFSAVDVAGERVLAPAQSRYEVRYMERLRRRDRTESTFSGFRRFASTARLLD